MGKKHYRPPLSGDLWTQYESLTKLPALAKSDAKTLWMVLGIAFGLVGSGAAFALCLTGHGGSADPMLSSSVLENIPSWLLLAVMTALIGFKQWRYYFGNGSPKDGIFVRRIRQASEREQVADVALSIAGGLLVGSCFWPSYWFLVFGFYCFLVILRCYITLLRPRYAAAAKRRGEEVPEYFEKSLDRIHNGLRVKGVLAGWIVSDALFVAYSTMAFLRCFFFGGRLGLVWRLLMFGGLAGTLAFLFLHFVRKYSYRWGLWALSLGGDPGTTSG